MKVMKKRNIFVLSLLAGFSLSAAAQKDSTGVAFADQLIEVGANKDFTRAQSTAAVSVITSRDVNKRSAKNIGNLFWVRAMVLFPCREVVLTLSKILHFMCVDSRV